MNSRRRPYSFNSFAHDNVEVTSARRQRHLTGISKSVVDYRGEVSSSPRRFMNV